MGILLMWLVLDALIVWFLWRQGIKQCMLCDSCRYLKIGEWSKWGVCSILGTPATCKECKYYEQWGSNK